MAPFAGSTATMRVYVAGIIASLVMIGGCYNEPPQHPTDCQSETCQTVAVAAALALTAGLLYFSFWSYSRGQEKTRRQAEEAQRADEARQRAEQAARDTRRSRAWDVTKAAMTAARNGDCATAASFDAQVRAIDADFHDTVFVRDAGIARCLAGNAPVPAAATPAPAL